LVLKTREGRFAGLGLKTRYGRFNSLGLKTIGGRFDRFEPQNGEWRIDGHVVKS
jgi:hypothetical protein